ncbi:hypothetical protein AA0312_0051 [Acetobacter tropicalis NRIC 0312]|nr:hypothetical protein AA0312_0051 [Acetobacter tropicalis NRIC 0312]
MALATYKRSSRTQSAIRRGWQEADLHAIGAQHERLFSRCQTVAQISRCQASTRSLCGLHECLPQRATIQIAHTSNSYAFKRTGKTRLHHQVTHRQHTSATVAENGARSFIRQQGRLHSGKIRRQQPADRHAISGKIACRHHNISKIDTAVAQLHQIQATRQHGHRGRTVCLSVILSGFWQEYKGLSLFLPRLPSQTGPTRTQRRTGGQCHGQCHAKSRSRIRRIATLGQNITGNKGRLRLIRRHFPHKTGNNRSGWVLMPPYKATS